MKQMRKRALFLFIVLCVFFFAFPTAAHANSFTMDSKDVRFSKTLSTRNILYDLRVDISATGGDKLCGKLTIEAPFQVIAGIVLTDGFSISHAAFSFAGDGVVFFQFDTYTLQSFTRLTGLHLIILGH